MEAWYQISKLNQIHNFIFFTENLQKTDKYIILIFNQQTRMTNWLMQSSCQMVYIGIKLWVLYLALKLALDSRVLALVLVSRVQTSASASASASALALKGPGLGLGLGLGLEGPGLGLVLGVWILALTTTLAKCSLYVRSCVGIPSF